MKTTLAFFVYGIFLVQAAFAQSYSGITTLERKYLGDASFMGTTHLNDILANSLSVTGALEFHTLKVKNNAKMEGVVTNSEGGEFGNLTIIGSFTAKNITCNNLDVIGSLEAEQITVRGYANIIGSLKVKKGYFTYLDIVAAEVKNLSDKIILEDVDVDHITIKNKEGQQTLLLRGKTFVKGDIRFESGKGIVESGGEGVKIEGKVEGGLSECFHASVILKGSACQEKQQPYDPETLKKGFIGYTLEATPPIVADKHQLPNLHSFTFEGKPIGPECLLPFVVLKKYACQEQEQPFDPEVTKKRFIGDKPKMKKPYIFYKDLGEIAVEYVNHNLLEVQWSDGSSESASGLFLVQRKDNSLELLQILDQGDRCFGSIHDAKVTGGVETYSKRLTPQGLLAILYKEKNGDEKENVKKFSSSFEDCAVCCVGDMTFKGSDIVSMKFTQTPLELKNKLKQEDAKSPQACFDTLLLKELESGKTSLTPEQLKAFGQKVKEHCILQRFFLNH